MKAALAIFMYFESFVVVKLKSKYFGSFPVFIRFSKGVEVVFWNEI